MTHLLCEVSYLLSVVFPDRGLRAAACCEPIAVSGSAFGVRPGCPGRPEVVILIVISETMPLAKVKAHLSEVVDRVTASHERVNITRHGHREAVVIAADDLDALEDTLDILSNPDAVREIAEAREAAARGEGLDLAEVRRRYLSRGA